MGLLVRPDGGVEGTSSTRPATALRSEAVLSLLRQVETTATLSGDEGIPGGHGRGREGLTRFVAELIFAIIMLLLGGVAIISPHAIRSAAIKLLGGKAESATGLAGLVDSSQVLPSIRFGGAMALLIGLFVLWVVWRQQ